MNKINFKDLIIKHTIKKGLKNSYITIKPDSLHVEIELRTSKVSQRYITDLLTQRESWIRKQLSKLQNRPNMSVNLEDEVLLFGEICSIDLEEFKSLRAYLFKLKDTKESMILKCYDRFYRDYAQKYITLRVDFFAQKMELNYSELKYRKMKSRWGSCNSKGVITINTQLLKLTKEQIDYVLVHELSHLVHLNHSKEFHSLVDIYIANSKKIRSDIKALYLTL